MISLKFLALNAQSRYFRRQNRDPVLNPLRYTLHFREQRWVESVKYLFHKLGYPGTFPQHQVPILPTQFLRQLVSAFWVKTKGVLEPIWVGFFRIGGTILVPINARLQRCNSSSRCLSSSSFGRGYGLLTDPWYLEWLGNEVRRGVTSFRHIDACMCYLKCFPYQNPDKIRCRRRNPA